MDNQVQKIPVQKFIRDVTPHLREWTCRVMVVEKGEPDTIKGTATRIQKLVLIDDKGDKVHLAMFNREIERRKDTLVPFQNYEISNATVKDVELKYRISETPYQWTVNPRTYIEEASVPVQPEKEIFQFTTSKDFKPLVDSPNLIDVIAQVIAVKPLRELQLRSGPAVARDVLLIDESMSPFLLTLWDSFAKNDGHILETMFYEADHSLTLIATRLKVSSFEGISLSTRLTSTLMIDPPIPRAAELLQWATENVIEIQNALDNFKSVSWSDRIGGFDESIAIPVSQALARAETSTDIWVKAAATVAKTFRPLYAMACEDCGYEINTHYMKAITCPECKAKSHAIAKAKVNVVLRDDSGTVPALVEGDVAESLFGFRAKELAESDDKASAVLRQLLSSNSADLNLFHLKRYARNKLKVYYYQILEEHSPPPIQGQASRHLLLPSTEKPGSSATQNRSVKRALQFDMPASDAENREKIPKTLALHEANSGYCSSPPANLDDQGSTLIPCEYSDKSAGKEPVAGKVSFPITHQQKKVISDNLVAGTPVFDNPLKTGVSSLSHDVSKPSASAVSETPPQSVSTESHSHQHNAEPVTGQALFQSGQSEYVSSSGTLLSQGAQQRHALVTVKLEKTSSSKNSGQLSVHVPGKDRGTAPSSS